MQLKNALLLIACIATQAQAEPAQALFDSVAVFAAQGADHNLKELPGRIVAGDIAWEKSYFNALGLRKTGEAVGQRWKVLQGTPLAAILQGHELSITGCRIMPRLALRTPCIRPIWNWARQA